MTNLIEYINKGSMMIMAMDCEMEFQKTPKKNFQKEDIVETTTLHRLLVIISR